MDSGAIPVLEMQGAGSEGGEENAGAQLRGGCTFDVRRSGKNAGRNNIKVGFRSEERKVPGPR